MGLFKFRGFLPFILIIFINALVDVGHKMVIQNTLYKSFSGDTLVVLTALVNLLILLPYAGMSSISGFLNDKFSRVRVTRYAAMAEAALIALVTICYFFGLFYIAFFLTLILAVQSAIYSPAKLGMIKNMVGAKNLGAANGISQAVSIVAILLSTIGVSVIFENLCAKSDDVSEILQSVWIIGVLLFVLSVLETACSFFIPMQSASEPNAKFDKNKFIRLGYLRDNMSYIFSARTIWLCTLGLSFFWAISQLVIAVFPAHYKFIMQTDNPVFSNAILALSIIGICIGSFVAGSYSKNHIEMGIVPLGAFGMGIGLVVFSFAGSNFTMACASVFFGFSGGIFMVPLNAQIQLFSDEAKMGRVLAASNFVQNVFMILFLIFAIFAVALEISTSKIFIISALAIFVCAAVAIKILPHLFARMIAMPFLKFSYKVGVYGLDNVPLRGGVLLLGNHVSWIDWAILQIATPRPIKFVMYKSFYDLWYLKWFFKWFRVIPIGLGANKSSLEKIHELLKNGEVVALFPEGHITYNGQLDEFHRGFELSVKESGATIVPFYIRGLWGSSFSRSQKYFSQISTLGHKRSISVSFGANLPDSTNAEAVKKAVYALSFYSWDKYLNTLRPIQYNWLISAKSHPFKKAIVDSTGANLTNAKVIAGAMVMADKFKKILQNRQNVGVILPSSAAGSLANLTLLMRGKIPVNLNYTLSMQNLISCVERAEISQIITSKTFITKLSAKGFNLDEISSKFIFLEDLQISNRERILAYVKALIFPAWLIEMLYFSKVGIDDDALILFSSGSESAPKGVVLTHKNLMANIKQMSELINAKDGEAMMASLPIFHCFGLSVTALLPLSEGILSIHVPDPTDAPNVGKMAIKHGATLLFGTSTFFRLYTKNKKLNHLMFDSVRLVIAGAEKLRTEVKNDFKMKFGIEIFEGYGTTETTPVVSVNTPNILEPEFYKELIFNKVGSVGMPLTGTIIKIVDPATSKEVATGENGLILIGGHQVMRGYYRDEERTNRVISEIDGVRFYNSGDIGHLDEDGFLYITDRLSRFAKIGGEMISLSAVESEISKIIDQNISFACLNLPDEKKGEKIVMFFADTSAEAIDENSELRANLQSALKALPPLFQPSVCVELKALPTLASGKTDFQELKKIAAKMEL